VCDVKLKIKDFSTLYNYWHNRMCANWVWYEIQSGCSAKKNRPILQWGDFNDLKFWLFHSYINSRRSFLSLGDIKCDMVAFIKSFESACIDA
jgi:hypothetical protein